MIPVGYLAKRVSLRPDWLSASQVVDIYSVSGCISEDFADYISFWRHNGYWLFDSPEIIRTVAGGNSIGLDGRKLFYYEAYEQEFDGKSWHSHEPELSVPTAVVLPSDKLLEGFDVVTFAAGNAPECSPLSRNSLAEEITTNAHCLLPSFEEARRLVTSGIFRHAEPGPYRVFAVYTVDWP